jgi:hypothetical protein
VAIWKNLQSEGYLMIWSDFGQLTGVILFIIGALLSITWNGVKALLAEIGIPG